MAEDETLSLIEPLTERELDVLRLMGEGLSNRDIAEQFVISTETVRWYTKQIYSKLGVHSRAQAILRAQELRIFGDVAQAEAQPALDSPRLNLPNFPLAFLGREAELDDLRTMLRDHDIRLVTVAGPGGIGKTRLCVEAVRTLTDHFADGVCFVPLVTAASVDDIVSAIARALHLRLDASPREQLLHYLRNRQLLLLLDSFEHILQGVDLISDILENTTGVTVLVTSHTSLNLRGEWVRQLDGFALPDPADPVLAAQTTAVELFANRARRVRGDFSLEDNLPSVIEICRLIDGMPLAIELAASWAKSLRCQDIAREIKNNIDFLMTRERDIDERHRSIRAVFDYSWRLLDDHERRIMRRLAVFRGGFGYEAARQVAGVTPQDMADLIDRSLLYQTSDGLYSAHDLLRQYVERHLETIDTTELSTRSTIIVTWVALLKGDFERARKVAEEIASRDAEAVSVFEEAFGLALLGVLAGFDGHYAECQQLCQASINMVYHDRTLHDPITSVFAHLGLALFACDLQDYHTVRRNILAAIETTRTLQIPALNVMCLPVTAIVFAHQAEVERASELLALAFTHPAGTSAWLERWGLVRRLRHDLQTELGDDAFTSSWQRGSQLDLQTVTDTLIDDLSAVDT